MSIKIDISGLGCTGRLVFRMAVAQPDVFRIVGINDPFIDLNYMMYMIKYDTMYDRFEGRIDTQGGKLLANGRTINVHAEKDSANILWGADDAEYVVESTGVFATKGRASVHIAVGAKKIVISAPARDDTPALAYGVNLDIHISDTTVVSDASCTISYLIPLVKVIDNKFSVAEDLTTMAHSTIVTQKTVDSPSAKDQKGDRAASGNIIPSSTGATEVAALVTPELKGRLAGTSFRVPILDVSAVDLTYRLEKSAIYGEICTATKEASENEIKGILGHTEDIIVSSDFLGDPRTSIFDTEADIMLNPNFVRLVSWYDNEWGYNNKVLDLISHIFSVDRK